MFPLIGSITDVFSGQAWQAYDIQNAVSIRVRELKSVGVDAGARVLLAYGDCAEFFVDLFAIWECGGAAACVPPSVTDQEFDNLCSFIQPVSVVAPLHGAQDFPALHVPRIRKLDSQSQDARERSDPSHSREPETPALILFTSGTTGTPKGVVLSRRAVKARIDFNLEYMPVDNFSRALCVLPTHFGHGLIGNCLTPMAGGGNLYLMPGNGLKIAQNLTRIIQQYGITFLSSTPALWRLVLRGEGPGKPSTVRQVGIGSAMVPAPMVKEVAEWADTRDVRVMYGITEMANWISGYSLNERDPEDGLVGRMWRGEASVLNEAGERQSCGEGEILLKSPTQMTGYFNQEDLTASVLSDGWFHTGDKGRISQDGSIWLTGRIKDEINRAGIKISPDEIDALVERHPDVEEACTFSIPDPIAGELVAILVRLGDAADVDAVSLRKWCSDHIRHECVPDRWRIVAEVPKTERGKLDRNRARSLYLGDAN